MTGIESIRSQKKTIREKMRSEREKLTAAEAITAGTRILEALLAGEVPGISLVKNRMVALYVSDKNEPDFSGMLDTLRSKDIRFCYPAVRSGAIGFFSLPAAVGFISGELGIMEPGETAHPIQPAEIDVILVPGMAFDLSGGRLGRGKGLFDRCFAGIPKDKMPLLVGTGYDFQILDHVPVEETDISMDYIFTPTQYLRNVRA